MTEDDTLEALQGIVAVIAGSEPYTDRVLAGLPQLRVISRNGVGYDRIDVPAATRRGVAVTITPDGNHQAVAEHAMALLLAVARSIVSQRHRYPARQLAAPAIMIPLRGKTLGIVGLGRIGRSVAVRGAAFGMRIVGAREISRSRIREDNTTSSCVDLRHALVAVRFRDAAHAHVARDQRADQSQLARADEARQRAGQHGPRRAGRTRPICSRP